MATTPDPFVATTVTAPVNTGAAIAAATQPFDNTEEVIIYNEDAANTILVGILISGAGTAIPVATGTHVPALSSITLRIGTVANRGAYGTAAGEKTIYYTSNSAATTTVARITYVSSFGST